MFIKGFFLLLLKRVWHDQGVTHKGSQLMDSHLRRSLILYLLLLWLGLAIFIVLLSKGTVSPCLKLELSIMHSSVSTEAVCGMKCQLTFFLTSAMFRPSEDRLSVIWWTIDNLSLCCNFFFPSSPASVEIHTFSYGKKKNTLKKNPEEKTSSIVTLSQETHILDTPSPCPKSTAQFMSNTHLYRRCRLL